MSSIDHQHVELLAYACWEARGRPIGEPEADWFRALELLRTDLVTDGIPLSAVHAGPGEVTASAPRRRRPTARRY